MVYLPHAFTSRDTDRGCELGPGSGSSTYYGYRGRVCRSGALWHVCRNGALWRACRTGALHGVFCTGALWRECHSAALHLEYLWLSECLSAAFCPSALLPHRPCVTLWRVCRTGALWRVCRTGALWCVCRTGALWHVCHTGALWRVCPSAALCHVYRPCVTLWRVCLTGALCVEFRTGALCITWNNRHCMHDCFQLKWGCTSMMQNLFVFCLFYLVPIVCPSIEGCFHFE